MENTHRFYIVKNCVSLIQKCETLAPVIQNSSSGARRLPSLQPVPKAYFHQNSFPSPRNLKLEAGSWGFRNRSFTTGCRDAGAWGARGAFWLLLCIVPAFRATRKCVFSCVWWTCVLYLRHFIAKIDFGPPIDAIHFLHHSSHFGMKTASFEYPRFRARSRS